MKKSLLLVTALFAFTGMVYADDAVQLALTPDIAIQPRTEKINVFSLGVWSENPQSSFTLGFVTGSTGDSGGFTWSLFNYGENYKGVQFAFGNVYSGNVTGWQASTVNLVQGKFVGFQSGVVNFGTQEVEGVQAGFFNYAKSLHGIQVGMICVAENNPWFKEFPNKLATGFPFFNWSF
jgi:hypothetical protein